MYAINSKIFYLTTYFIFGGSSLICINTVSLGTHEFFGVSLRLQSSCVWVNTVYRTQLRHCLLGIRRQNVSLVMSYYLELSVTPFVILVY